MKDKQLSFKQIKELQKRSIKLQSNIIDFSKYPDKTGKMLYELLELELQLEAKNNT